MDLLILFSAAKKGQLLSLATILHQKSIRFHPWELPSAWSFLDSADLVHYLKDHTHWLILTDTPGLSHPAVVFALGYGAAVHERCYLLEPEAGTVPGAWRSLLHVSQDFGTLVVDLEGERARWALFLNRLEAKGKLVERGLEATNSSFIEAVVSGDSVSTALFLQAGFSPDLTDKKGVPLLCLAVRSSHLSVIRELLNGGADINLRSKDRDNSPIMDAAAEGLTDIAAELVARGADLAGVSRNGQNALVLAIGKGAQDLAVVLLEAGADPFVADKLGMDASQYARLLGRKDFLAKAAEKYPDRIQL